MPGPYFETIGLENSELYSDSRVLDIMLLHIPKLYDYVYNDNGEYIHLKKNSQVEEEIENLHAQLNTVQLQLPEFIDLILPEEYNEKGKPWRDFRNEVIDLNEMITMDDRNMQFVDVIDKNLEQGEVAGIIVGKGHKEGLVKLLKEKDIGTVYIDYSYIIKDTET